MRTLCAVAMLCLSAMLMAQTNEVTIDGHKFTNQNGTWVHDALGSSYTLTKDYTAVYRDTRWNKWYAEGSPQSFVKKVLDLGPNVVFQYKSSADKQPHTFACFRSKKAVTAALAGGSAAIAGGLGGAAAGAAAAGAGAAAAGAGAAAAGAAAATGATIMGVSVATAAVVGGAVVAGAVIVENNNGDGASKTKK